MEDSEVEEDYARVKRRERGSGKENKHQARARDNRWHRTAGSKPSMSVSDIKCNREIIVTAAPREVSVCL